MERKIESLDLFIMKWRLFPVNEKSDEPYAHDPRGRRTGYRGTYHIVPGRLLRIPKTDSEYAFIDWNFSYNCFILVKVTG